MAGYFRPTKVEDALEILAQGDITVAAGCTDLFPATEAKVLPGSVLDITQVQGLRGITQDSSGFRIGAATTWTDIITASLPASFDGLKQAACEVGSVQIQNAGTIAGNLCTASPAGDGLPCLLTLDAQVELASIRGVRRLVLSDFLTGPRQTALAADEMVTAIHVPDLPGQGQFLKLGARKYLVISIAMVAARVDVLDGVIRDIALAVGAASPTAQRLTEVETALLGQPVSKAVASITRKRVAPALSPIDDIRADAAYRVTAATELTRRVFTAVTTDLQAVA